MKFSIVFLYSPDRESQFKKTLECLAGYDGFDKAEKIVCIDGEGWTPKDLVVKKIDRRHNFFCWADSLNSGVLACSNEKVIYMDSDRIPPSDFFTRSLNELEKEATSFVYPSSLFSLARDEDVETMKKIRDNPQGFKGRLIPDHRQNDPSVLHRKNAMSGCVAFCKSHFLRLGGFDNRFLGWGYPDYDFLMTAISSKSFLIPLQGAELHQKHQYSSDQREFTLHNLYNLNQYVIKWNLKPSLVQNACKNCRVDINTLRSSRTLEHFLLKVMRKEGRSL